MARRIDRSEAGREVLSASERLMDGLLQQEHRCFARIAEGLAQLSQIVWLRTVAVHDVYGRRGLEARIAEVLPRDGEFDDVVMPPVGDLLAVARERTLTAARRQLRACETAVPTRFAGHSTRAMRYAKDQVAGLERHWFDTAREGMLRGAARTRLGMGEQSGIWASRGEDLAVLRTRWLDTELLKLPGSSSRGAVWEMRVWMNAEARKASVSFTNSLLLASMDAWNRVDSVAV